MVNEQFFEKETKAMWYVLGAFYKGYDPISGQGIKFTSAHKELVQIIKGQLDCSQEIVKKPNIKRQSYSIRIPNVPHLNYALYKRDLNVPQDERRFPENVPEDYINHFVRGFLDAQVYIRTVAYHGTGDTPYTNILINFNQDFVVSLHNVFKKYANVNGSGQLHTKPSNQIVYGNEDRLGIYAFIYQDWEYIQEQGLYLTSKEKSFKIEPEDIKKAKTIIRQAQWAKKMLEKYDKKK